ncbi:MAG: hypothetical protein QOK82_09155 [Nitrososphaeraceae archaeon]|nr:hypothetical protein [Nitrososphaeraceae archaeon]
MSKSEYAESKFWKNQYDLIWSDMKSRNGVFFILENLLNLNPKAKAEPI